MQCSMHPACSMHTRMGASCKATQAVQGDLRSKEDTTLFSCRADSSKVDIAHMTLPTDKGSHLLVSTDTSHLEM